jgi:hypothetical protein
MTSNATPVALAIVLVVVRRSGGPILALRSWFICKPIATVGFWMRAVRFTEYPL